jgi:hypothetical protein
MKPINDHDFPMTLHSLRQRGISDDEIRNLPLLNKIERRIAASTRLTLMDLGYRGEQLERMVRAMRGDKQLRDMKAAQLRRQRARSQRGNDELPDEP